MSRERHFPAQRLRRARWVLALLVVFTGTLRADPPAADPAGWAEILRLDFATVATPEPPAGEQARLAWALAWLNRQPRTEVSLAKGRAELERLAAKAADGDVRVLAAYNRVRADDAFVRAPDYPAVQAAYLEVAQAYPGHVFGELALVKAMMIDLTHTLGERDVLAVAEAWRERVTGLRREAIRRGALVALATALIHHDRAPARAESWLQEADYAAFQRWDFRWRAQLRAVYLALKQDDAAAAKALAESFAQRFPRSPRIELVQGLAAGEVPLP